jgi:hypothetical protein
MANGGLEHETQRNDLVVEGAARWRLIGGRLPLGHLHRLLATDRRGGRAMDAVLLHLAGSDLRNAEFAEV